MNFGTPISMRAYSAERRIDFRTLDGATRFAAIERLGGEILEAVAAAVPVLPVSLLATVFVHEPERALSTLEIKSRAQALIDRLAERRAYVHIPRADHDYAVTVGLRMLVLRHFVRESGGLYRAAPGERGMLRYYANAIAHFLDGSRAAGACAERPRATPP